MGELFTALGWAYEEKDGHDHWVWAYGPCRLRVAEGDDFPHKTDDECPRPRSVFEVYAVDDDDPTKDRWYKLYRDDVLVEHVFEDDGEVQDWLQRETGLPYDALRDDPKARLAWEKASGTVVLGLNPPRDD